MLYCAHRRLAFEPTCSKVGGLRCGLRYSRGDANTIDDERVGAIDGDCVIVTSGVIIFSVRQPSSATVAELREARSLLSERCVDVRDLFARTMSGHAVATIEEA